MEMRKLSELKATNPYLRLGTDVSELEKSIQTLGLIAPLVISKDNLILAGARRYQALLNLGYTEAPVMVVDKGELEKELVSIDENLVRKDLSKIEIEAHLRRAKEIYQNLNPIEEIEEETVEQTESSDEDKEEVKTEVLPAQKFLNMVAEKTGLSPRQIHQAILRDEKASPAVKEARKKGKLSLSQTNEIVKLSPEEQEEAIEFVKELPVREIKKFVKTAQKEGVTTAITKTPKDPNHREFSEIEQNLKKVLKKMKQLELEGVLAKDLPESIQVLLQELTMARMPELNNEVEINSFQ
ncbi:MAG: ParB N-terminal domain-containing protein [Bacteriovoracaceae bacterium]